jgi:hypothetical protein
VAPPIGFALILLALRAPRSMATAMLLGMGLGLAFAVVGAYAHFNRFLVLTWRPALLMLCDMNAAWPAWLEGHRAASCGPVQEGRFVKSFVLALVVSMALVSVAQAETATQTPAATNDPAATQTQPSRPAGRDPRARRCVDRTPIGSRLSQRECHTNAEWEEIEGAARRMAAENGSHGRSIGCDGDASMCSGVGRTTQGP